MKPIDIIRDAEIYAQEHLEMIDEPYKLISIVLANRIISLQDYVEYLEKRLKNNGTGYTRVASAS